MLSDGTVVPCCLDADGQLALGNLLTDDLMKMLSSERAKLLLNGFPQSSGGDANMPALRFQSR